MKDHVTVVIIYALTFIFFFGGVSEGDKLIAIGIAALILIVGEYLQKIQISLEKLNNLGIKEDTEAIKKEEISH